MAGRTAFSPDPALYPDPSGRAGRICGFVNRLRLWEGAHAGRRFDLHDWQTAIIRRIYGPTTESGGRQVRMAVIWIPRGNAKTTLASALALAHFLGPEAEPGGQIVMAAADRENAGIAFNSAHQFVQQDQVLAKRVRPIESRKTLLHPGTQGKMSAISTEAYSKHGLNVSFFLADEVHAWPAAEARKLFGVVTDSMVKRTNPLTIVISTAGEGQGTLASDLWQYSHKVASGEIEDPTFAPIIFAADPVADWRDEAAWRSANPAIEAGFLSLEELRTKAKRIAHFPAEISSFKRFHLNIWTDGAAEPWVDLAVYDEAEPMRPQQELLGQPCWVGVDLSSVEDLTAVVAVFPVEDEDGIRLYDIVPMFFLPEANIARKAEQDQADYLRWAEAGHLRLTPGNVVDYSAVLAWIDDLAEDHSVQEIAIDRWNSTAITTALQEAGFTVAAFGQGFASMAAPVKELKAALLSGRFRHGCNPVLRMCFGNVAAETDAAENEKLHKARSRGRIDGAVAAAMAVGRILANETGPSVYATQRPEGFLVI
ncbi:MAG TPA: terminase TerL endonuclease subunit [Geminicoccus sp.]|jgi:phage terminase large subunit-like protein|uniref:terminase large subunit n=1 Tax=Geminicoccus sp. TaxID=2024832 RepID=UPI002E34012A|nr:terminase TerL endonuclease subunit [Geminicoccus sp.]HEX2527449.1 terminase TerL endonuclease subunit [Geminicoccus sp.]